MSVTLKCWLALVLARLNTDSHSIANSVIRGKSIMMIQTALRTTATFSMHQNLQILSPSTLRGSWEMRPFIVPFRIVIAAMEGAWCLSNVLITLVLFLFPKTVYWFLRKYFSFYFFLLLVYINCKHKLVPLWRFHTWVNVLWPCSSSPSLPPSSSSPLSFFLPVYK